LFPPRLLEIRATSVFSISFSSFPLSKSFFLFPRDSSGHASLVLTAPPTCRRFLIGSEGTKDVSSMTHQFYSADILFSSMAFFLYLSLPFLPTPLPRPTSNPNNSCDRNLIFVLQVVSTDTKPISLTSSPDTTDAY